MSGAVANAAGALVVEDTLEPKPFDLLFGPWQQAMGRLVPTGPGSAFSEPSTRTSADLLTKWGKELPLVVVTNDEPNVAKSFRNIDKVVVTAPSELEVSAVVWARSVLVTQDALESVQGRAS